MQKQNSITFRPIASGRHGFLGHGGVMPPGEATAKGTTTHRTWGTRGPTWNIQVIALKRFAWSSSISQNQILKIC